MVAPTSAPNKQSNKAPQANPKKAPMEPPKKVAMKAPHHQSAAAPAAGGAKKMPAKNAANAAAAQQNKPPVAANKYNERGKQLRAKANKRFGLDRGDANVKEKKKRKRGHYVKLSLEVRLLLGRVFRYYRTHRKKSVREAARKVKKVFRLKKTVHHRTLQSYVELDVQRSMKLDVRREEYRRFPDLVKNYFKMVLVDAAAKGYLRSVTGAMYT